MMPITIGIADDHLLVMQGIKGMLDGSNFQVLFSAVNGKGLLDCLDENQPDVLLDIQMPDMNGVDLCRTITRCYPDIKIIALTNMDELHYVKQMIRNGASGYLLKNVDQLNLKLSKCT